jgi:hypothetical protein
MSGIQQTLLGGSPAGYQIERSLRFNSADSAYLSRTPASAGNRKTWTWSGWVKRSALGTTQFLEVAYTGATTRSIIYFSSDNALSYFDQTSGSTNASIITTSLYRDVSSWYHIVIAIDTTQATSSNRAKLYVNGAQITSFSTATYPSQNFDTLFNATNNHNLGCSETAGTAHFSGYLTEVNFIDGQALTPSDFGETDAATGVWKPKRYTGTYGTNGFYLNFSDNSNTTAATLGKDSSGNGNNWTPNGFSVAAGVGNDSLVDTPTSYGTDTGAGGEVRGNYATLNPLINPSADTFSNGNLQVVTSSSNYGTSVSTMATPTTGKWYAECTIVSTASYAAVGICSTSSVFTATSWIGSLTGVTYYGNSGQKFVNASGSAYGATYGANDVIGVAYDADNLQITFYKNGTTQGTITGVTSGAYYFGSSEWDTASGTQVWNFGQRPFQKWNGSAYVANTAPSGFKALCTQNLPTPTIGATSTTQANDYFNTVRYPGTGSSQSITGVGFQPDFVWIKELNGAADHGLYDAVRGVQKQMESNTITAESTETTGLTAFGTDGFTVGALAQLNTNTDTYVAWCWKANGAGSTNTAGTITSTVSANTTAGFSVLTYNPGNTSGTIGHGLGVAPQFIIVRSRTNSGGDPWGVYHVSLGNTKYLRLNTTNAEATLSTVWNDTSPTDTVVSIGTSDIVSSADTSFIMYCFAPVAGYSAFGSYTGNGSTNGPFVYLGFRPRWILFKSTNGTNKSWWIADTARDTYNIVGNLLAPNSADAEVTGNSFVDYISNGFKLRDSWGGANTNGETYIYAAFAEFPFKYSLAR